MSRGPVHDARARIAPHLEPTPVKIARGIEPSGRLVLKREDLQPTGAFKVRGAFSRLTSLGDDAVARGVIAASTGNHGAAVAFAARALGVRAAVLVPEPTPDARVAAIEALGGAPERFGPECGAAEAEARRRSEAGAGAFVSPYNDAEVMAGQGTIALELLEQAPEVTRVYVAVGGGGLVGGIAAGLAEAGADVEVVGCSPDADAPMEASVAAGRIVDPPRRSTLSIATAGALEPGAVTLEACARGVDRWLRCDEAAIAAALRRLHGAEGIVAEGAAAVALACWAGDPLRRPEDHCCVVVCGGNLDPEHRASILEGPGGAVDHD